MPHRESRGSEKQHSAALIHAALGHHCRGDPTRTGDHLVPNQVRYQLRYAPKSGCKGKQLL